MISKLLNFFNNLSLLFIASSSKSKAINLHICLIFLKSLANDLHILGLNLDKFHLVLISKIFIASFKKNWNMFHSLRIKIPFTSNDN